MRQHVMNMGDDDSRRLDEIRKYAAIYGRFDCKRKPEKPLTLHEVRVSATPVALQVMVQDSEEVVDKTMTVRVKGECRRNLVPE